MNLKIIEGSFSICRLKFDSHLPEWIFLSSFYSITKTSDELSVVCESIYIPKDVLAEKDWCLIKVKGPLDFSLTGILASLANPLALAKVSIFAISTFDTDYLMVKQNNTEKAKQILETSGFVFI